MTTRSLREALEMIEEAWPGRAILGPARSEVEAIEASDREARVADFHRACALPVASEPTVGTPEQRELRVRLMLEEVLEFARASAVQVFADVGRGGIVHDVTDLSIEADDHNNPDLVAMTHELSDVQYVTSGTAVELGLPLAAAFSEVHAANMRKVGTDGKAVMCNGKVMKPEGWVPADVAKVLGK